MTTGRRHGVLKGIVGPGLAGAVAGFVATGAMTLVMQQLHRRLPVRERYPLPPRLITERIIAPPDAVSAGVTLAAHFAYGAATGALYPAAKAVVGTAPATGGASFGVLVWAASYLGWIPAAGVLTAALHHPARRNALMIAAHVVWGTTTALLYHRLHQPSTAFAGPVPLDIPELLETSRTVAVKSNRVSVSANVLSRP
jgi:hypothetical protein